jgi:hypothetical protein
MLEFVLVTAILVAGTVAIHSIGLAFLLNRVARHATRPPKAILPIAWLLIRVTWLLLLIHAAEILIWGLYFLREGHLADLESAIYFSGVTYFTIGYGDVVMARPWRMAAPIEGATGILMCGLSTGLFFAIVTRIYGAQTGPRAD